MITNLPIVVAFGGGTDSSAVLILMRRRNIVPWVILFANTHGEKPHTIVHVARMSAWCRRNGFPPIVVVSNIQTAYDSLEDECLKNTTLPSIVFGYRSCSDKWKVRAQNHFLGRMERPRPFCRVVGFDAGEAHRAEKFIDTDRDKFWFPLIEWKVNRARAREVILEEGLPLPGKSACFYCPSSTKREVLELKRMYPHLFDRAVAMERNAANRLVQIKGLGRHWSWEQLAQADEDQAKLFPEAVQVPCDCVDGDNDEG